MKDEKKPGKYFLEETPEPPQMIHPNSWEEREQKRMGMAGGNGKTTDKRGKKA